MITMGKGSKIYPTAKVLIENRTIIIGKNCFIGDFALVASKELIMEDGSQINPHAILSGGGKIFLGKNSVIAFGAKLIPSTDRPEAKYMCEAAPKEQRNVITGSITLGKGAYIGSGAVICVSPKCPHIVIGDYAVVGALTYIDKSIPSYTIVHPKVELVMKKRVIQNEKEKT